MNDELVPILADEVALEQDPTPAEESNFWAWALAIGFAVVAVSFVGFMLWGIHTGKV